MMMGQRAAASAQRIFEILDTEPEVAERPGAVDLVDAQGAIELDGVRFGYGDVPVLTDVHETAQAAQNSEDRDDAGDDLLEAGQDE